MEEEKKYRELPFESVSFAFKVSLCYNKYSYDRISLCLNTLYVEYPVYCENEGG